MASTLRMRKPFHLKQRKMILLKVVQHLSPRVRGFRDLRFMNTRMSPLKRKIIFSFFFLCIAVFFCFSLPF